MLLWLWQKIIVNKVKMLNPTEGSNEQRRKVILITGSSVGIGLSLAKRLIENDNYFLVLTARETSHFRFKDESIYEAKNIWLRDLDVLNSDQIKTVIDEIVSKLGSVDILINNAGITDRSTVEDSSGIYRQVQMAVNYLAPFEIIGHVLSLMRKNRYGKIINISSAGGFMAMPTMSSYSASKFALEAASESLWYEMKPWDIHVTLVIPGFIDSLGFLNTTESSKCKTSSSDSTSTYFEHYKGMKKLISNNMHSSHSTNETIASKICKVIKMKKPPLRVYVTFDAWLFFWFRKILPPKIYHLIIYNFLPSISKWGKQSYKQ